VWVANGTGSVTELESSNGSFVRVIKGTDYDFNTPSGLASNGTDVWVANYEGDNVTELNASTGAFVKVLSGSAYEFDEVFPIVSAAGNVWVANNFSQTLTGFPAA
jgi:DNA-binding beta-propeller fold protein YncE